MIFILNGLTLVGIISYITLNCYLLWLSGQTEGFKVSNKPGADLLFCSFYISLTSLQVRKCLMHFLVSCMNTGNRH
jgi:hypothetical protein